MLLALPLQKSTQRGRASLSSGAAVCEQLRAVRTSGKPRAAQTDHDEPAGAPIEAEPVRIGVGHRRHDNNSESGRRPRVGKGRARAREQGSGEYG